jgi:hypothetical protein
MNSENAKRNYLEEMNVNVKVQLAALWSSFMFLYIYVDYFHLYMPESLESMMAGRVFEFEVDQIFIFASLASVAIPALMIFLSVSLPAKINRWLNLVIATAYIPYSLFNLVGEAWPHMLFGAALEVALLMLVIRYALKWPRVEHG